MKGPEGSLESVTQAKPFITIPEGRAGESFTIKNMGEDSLSIAGYRQPPKWKWSFNGDWYSMTVFCTSNPPNRFKRFIMRWFLNVYTDLIAEKKP